MSMKTYQKIGIALIAVAVLLAGAGWYLWHSLGRGDAKPPASPPRLTCDQPLKDVGETGVLTHEHSFTLVNSSSKPLRISSISKSCNCLETQLGKSKLAPGEKTTVKVKMEVRPTAMGTITHFAGELWLYLDDEKSPSLLLRLQGVHIPPAYILAYPIVISAPTKIGDSFGKDVDVFVNSKKGTEVTKVVTEGDLPLKATIKERNILKGERYNKVVVQVSGTLSRGMHLPETGSLIVHTNSVELPKVVVPISLLRTADEGVTVWPETFAFGVLKPGDRKALTTTLTWRRGSGYAFKKAYASGDGIDVQVGKVGDEADKVVLPITCQVDAGALKGTILREVIVQLALRDHTEVFKVPVNGFVKAAAIATPQ